jgi:hypothetical protein
VGGADEVRQLHEAGELRRAAVFCGACGGVRFVPCLACTGSRKVSVEDEGRTTSFGDCNENGLVRYLIQSSIPFLTCNQSLTLIFKNLHHLLNSLRPHQV